MPSVVQSITPAQLQTSMPTLQTIMPLPKTELPMAVLSTTLVRLATSQAHSVGIALFQMQHLQVIKFMGQQYFQDPIQ